MLMYCKSEETTIHCACHLALHEDCPTTDKEDQIVVESNQPKALDNQAIHNSPS